MTRTLILQPFSSFADLVRTHNLMLPVPRDTWRLVAEPCIGEVNGLPMMRGLAVATNGIMVVLRRSQPNDCIYAHYDWFVPDEEESAGSLRQAAANPNKKNKISTASKPLIDIMEFV